MKKTLYLLRKPVEQVDPALFLREKSQGDVVLLQESGGRLFPFPGGSVFSITDVEAEHALTYDGLVTKIFECDHTLVI
ncbi:MAG TPA: hypothetical protein VJQ25_02640 [Nitrospira sp.]|jgi:hypothetical protein|nr:hypothetical protein [Nitrospira sp.]